MRRLGFYPRYGRAGASSRLRFFAFFDRWRALPGAEGGCGGKCAGCPAAESCALRLAIHPGLSDRYLRRLYRGGAATTAATATTTAAAGFYAAFFWVKRLLTALLVLEDELVLEYELLPRLPWRWERWLLGRRRYVLNFDDNVWEKYRGTPNKFDCLCENAAGVIVANEFLYGRVRALNARVELIPTVVNLADYAREYPKYERFTVVWIGTPVTYQYLENALPALQAMSRSTDFELLVVARRELASRPLPGVRVRYVDWSVETEAEYLRRSHVGIMPLDDDEFSRGKSAYKLIQYQAAGLPALASPVGANRRVLLEGETGFLVNTPAEWAARLGELRENPALYAVISAGARAAAYEYSLEKYFPIYRNFVMECLQ